MSNLEISPPTVDPTPVFAALGDATRLELVVRLGDGQPRSIAQLTGGLGLSRQGVTKHLRVLQQAGLVVSRRSGRENQFMYVPEPIDQARSCLDAISEQWGDALLRLKAYVEP